MPNPIFFTACLLAICLPILSVQLPRTALFSRLCSNRAENRSAVRVQATAATATTDSSPSFPSTNPQSTPPFELLRRRGTTSQAAQGYDGAHSGAPASAGEEGDASKSLTRKPWDPPFPKREKVNGDGRRTSPPSQPRESRKTSGEIGLVKRLFLAGVDGESAAEDNVLVPSKPDREDRQDQGLIASRSKTAVIAWSGAAVLTAMLFLMAFAILIAHCLAWFLVYRTEARLGEARRGILTSGDMRLCLCAS